MSAWAILAAASILQGQQSIDFECRAATLSNVLGKLSRMTGKTFRAEQAMAGEVVCIKAEKVELSDLLKKLAEATSCEWRQDQDVQFLYRPKEVTAKYEKSDHEARVAWLKKLIEPISKSLAKVSKPYDRAQAFVEAIKALNKRIEERPMGVSLDGPRLAAPASILTQQLLIDLDPELLVSVPPGENWTFSNLPTSAQRPLGKNSEKYIREYIETEAQLGGMLPELPQDGMMNGLLDDLFSSAKSTEGVGKVLFNVRNSGSVMSFGCTVYTERGNVRSWGFTNTYQLGDNPWERERNAGINEKPVLVDLSEGSALFAKYADPEPDVARFPGERKSKPWEELPSTMKKLLRAPDEFDPLSFATTDGCLAMAGEAGKSMIAYLADGTEKAGSLSIKDGKLNLAKFKATLKVKGAEPQDSGSWMLIKPRNPIYATRYRLPRAALARFMKAAVDSRSITIETYSRLHFEGGMPMVFSSIARLYRKTLTLFGATEMADIDGHSAEAYRCIGSLSSLQWRELYNGGSIRIGGSTQETRNAAESWMRNGAIGLVMDPKAKLPELMEHWTEFAPNGLPQQAYLTLSEKAIAGIDPVNKILQPDGSMIEDVMGMGRGTEPAVLASAWAKGGYYKSFEQMRESLSKSKFQYTERTDLTFKLFLLPTHRMDETFSGSPTVTRRSTYDELPESVRKEFEETFKRELKGG